MPEERCLASSADIYRHIRRSARSEFRDETTPLGKTEVWLN
jgi:hypothetical protein